VIASKSFAFLDWPGPIAFAHRGGAATGPENTMASFARAVELGYRYLETDARVTSDGVLLAFHDETLDRVSDLTGRLEDRPWSEVKKARVGGEPIPTLEELLSAFPHVRFNIDPKLDRAVEPLVRALRRTGSEERVCVAAFSDRRLLAVRRQTGGRVCTALGPHGIGRLRAASYGVPVGPFGAACVQVPLRHRGRPLVDARFVRAAHRRRLPVHVWTIDDADEMRRLLDLGVDGIMTDEPAVLKEVLVSRGQWVE
jgi:glycerophosphoryl diester phosphodiesterase